MRFLATSFVIAFALLAQGCAAPGAKTAAASAQPQQPLVWPAAPATPRVRFVRSFTGPQDLGIAQPFWKRLLDVFGGAEADRFVRPTGVAAQDGLVYVADPGTPALWILDAPHGRSVKVTSVAGTALQVPVAVAPGPHGSVFLADTGLHMVFLVDRDGKLVRIAAQGGLQRPAGITYDPSDEWLYVADAATNQITVFGRHGQAAYTWGRAGERPGEFNHPTYLSLDRSGTLRVTDSLGFRIESFNREGRFVASFGHHGDGSGDFAAPKGVATDSAGHVYVVDGLFDAVQIFDPDGTLLLGFGGRGTHPGQFWLPGGAFIDAQDRLYVADSYNARVQVFLAEPAVAKESKP